MQKLAILNLAGESAGKRGYNITQQHTHLVWLHNVILFMYKYAGGLYVLQNYNQGKVFKRFHLMIKTNLNSQLLKSIIQFYGLVFR